MSQQETTTEGRAQTTLATFLDLRDGLPLPVRDYLEKYIDGRTLPYADRITETQYGDTELIVAVLADHIKSNDPLPEPAVDFVREYLYRLEEASDIHIWNTADVFRAAYTLMLAATGYEVMLIDAEDPPTSLIKAALRRLCTRRELSEFYDRHGLEDSRERAGMAGSVDIDEGNYKQAASQLSRYLADPRTDEKTRRGLGAGLVKLASLTNTHVDHPALAGRAMVLMFESDIMLGHSERNERDAPAMRAGEHLIANIDALPPMPDGEGGE